MISLAFAMCISYKVIMTANKTQEQRLRRALNKCGYSLCKSRKRISFDNFGGYMIVDRSVGCVVAGSRFDLSAENVQDFLAE